MDETELTDPDAGVSAIDFSVAIPVWNEADILVVNTLQLCAHLERLGRYELLIVNNGSSDGSVELAKAIVTQNPRVRTFELPAADVAGAFKVMLREARSDFLICLDMDLSADLGFVGEALRLLPSHDLVIGSKKLGEQKRSWARRLGSRVYVLCATVFLDLGAEDYSMGAKGYRVSFFLPIIDRIGHGTSYVVDCIYLARRHRARVVEIPISCQDLRNSKFNLL